MKLEYHRMHWERSQFLVKMHEERSQSGNPGHKHYKPNLLIN